MSGRGLHSGGFAPASTARVSWQTRMWSFTLIAFGVSGCAEPGSGKDTGDVGVEETALDTGVAATEDSAGSAWTPMSFGDCSLVEDVNRMSPSDTSFAASPHVGPLGAWFTVSGDDAHQRIARATVSAHDDGSVTWDDPHVVLEPFDFSATDLAGPMLFVDDDGSSWLFFDLIPAGGDGPDLWRCATVDGETFTDCAEVIAHADLPDDASVGVQLPYVVGMDGGYRSWFTTVDAAQERRVYTMVSDDLVAWTDPELVIDLGNLGGQDDASIYDPMVIAVDGGYDLFYAGLADGSEFAGKRLIEGHSTDARTWSDFVVVLEPGCAGADDTLKVDGPALVPDGDAWRLYYDGAAEPDGPRRIFTTRSTGGG